MRFSMRGIKYITVFLLPLTALLSMYSSDWKTYFTLLFAFGIIPLMEWVIGKSESNLTEAERELAREDKFYDLLLYITVPVQIFILFYFLFSLDIAAQSTSTIAGKITAMGIMCGVYGINVAHELGHRASAFERFLARVMLASSLYLHFYIEHNRGHHRNVGTSADSATARLNEPVYAFWVRTLLGSFFSAWQIVAKERKRKGLKVWSLSNEMIQYILIQLAIVLSIYWGFGIQIMLCFILAAFIGILLLETVNYVEHYGLTRKKLTAQRYEEVQAWHSLEFRLYTGPVGFVRTNKAQRPPLDAIQTLSGVGFHARCPPNAHRLSRHDALVVDAATMVQGDESKNYVNIDWFKSNVV